MAQRMPTRSRRRRKPRKKPASFIDAVLEMLESTAGKVMFGAGAVLLGKVLGSTNIPQIELPADVPPEIVAEWRRLTGGQPDAVEGDTGQKPKGKPKAPPRPEVVQLVKGEDGIYRPAGTE